MQLLHNNEWKNPSSQGQIKGESILYVRCIIQCIGFQDSS